MLIISITEEFAVRYKCKVCRLLLDSKELYGSRGKSNSVELKVDFLDMHWEYNSVPLAYEIPTHTCPLNLKWVLKEVVMRHLDLKDK